MVNAMTIRRTRQGGSHWHVGLVLALSAVMVSAMIGTPGWLVVAVILVAVVVLRPDRRDDG